MHTEFVMGNEAIALGALAAGVNVVAGYPGTPSTEVLENVAARNAGAIHVEWSINEKAAMEVAAGAAYAGARSLVTMKQVGLNVASDPLMSLEYIGVKGAMVVLVADDPGPISSQTEQDTRTFGAYSKIPVFDPSTVAEAYQMTIDAFALSQRLGSPVILRPTTRIDHGYATIQVADAAEYQHEPIEGFVKDSSRWVIFPRLSVRNHALIEKRNAELADELAGYEFNQVVEAAGSYAASTLGVVSHGASWAYALDALDEANHPCLLRVATPFPFPEGLAADFLDGLTEVLVIEELDPVLERALLMACGRRGIRVTIRGKLDGTVKPSGENTPDEVRALLAAFAGETCLAPVDVPNLPEPPALPVRPPVLCAGCPHRASFYAVKRAMRGKKTIFCGDIGCYTLGNAKPLDMCDTCLCMGAGIDIAQGVFHVEPDSCAFAFVGDSTFFASGITGSINGLFNQANMTLCVLDNSTTAMTGHQPHPGTGQTMMGDVVARVSIEETLRGIGVKTVETVNPLELDETIDTVARVASEPGFKAIIFKYPCVVRFKPRGRRASVDASKCVGCRRCINELGCPAITWDGERAVIDESQCTGCTLCEQVCPMGAIGGGEARDLGCEVKRQQDAERAEALAKQDDLIVRATLLADGMRRGSAQAKSAAAPAAPATGESDGPSRQTTVVMAGVGGQGTVLASKLVSSAAMARGMEVRTAETIGMSQRGGSVQSYLRLGGGVASPLIARGQADLIVGFEPGEAVRMLPYLREGGRVVVSTHAIYPVSALTGAAPYDPEALLDYLRSNVHDLVLVDTDEALRQVGSPKVMNVLLLGAAFGDGAFGITRDDLAAALKARLPERLWDVNLKALDFAD